MGKLRLRLCCGQYDRTKALFDGTVKPEGIDLTVVPYEGIDELFRRVFSKGDFEISEMSFSNYLYARSLRMGWVSLPVFVSRKFRQSYIFINARSGIEGPADLKGKRVGCAPSYYVTAAVWQRGDLQHEHGVRPQDLTWFTNKEERLSFKVPPGVSITVLEKGETCEKMLERGALDAMIGPMTPKSLGKSEVIKTLFENPKRVEIEYFRRTGIYPIMHSIAIKEEIVQKHPWVSKSLIDAFQKSKELWKKYTGSPFGGLAWIDRYIRQEEEIFGPDPFPYNVKDNLKTLQTLIQYCLEQGVIQTEMSVPELFPADVLN